MTDGWKKGFAYMVAIKDEFEFKSLKRMREDKETYRGNLEASITMTETFSSARTEAA